MTYAMKRVKFRAGKYKFKVPPACTAWWDTDTWITWIDLEGVWL